MCHMSPLTNTKCCGLVGPGTRELDPWTTKHQNWTLNRQKTLVSFTTRPKTGRSFQSVLRHSNILIFEESALRPILSQSPDVSLYISVCPLFMLFFSRTLKSFLAAVLLSALVERFFVSRMRHFFLANTSQNR